MPPLYSSIIAHGIGKTAYDRLAAIIDRLEAAGDEACDGPGNQYLAVVTTNHLLEDLLKQIQRAANIRVGDPTLVRDILLQKAMAQASARIGAEQIDLPATGRGKQFIDALQCRKDRLDRRDGHAMLLEILSRSVDQGLVCSH